MIHQLSFEFRTILLKRSVALTVFLVPLALIGLVLATNPNGEAAWRVVTASWSTLVVVFSIIFAIPMVTADRRDRLLFKRLLTSSLSRAQIVFCCIAPYFIIAVLQVVLVATCLIVLGEAELTNWILFIITTILLAGAGCTGGLALGTLSKSAERAQWTVLPVVLVAAISANFLPAATMDDWLRKILYFAPGGAFVDLFQVALGGAPYGSELFGFADLIAVGVSSTVCVFWLVVPYLFAKMRFRWDAR